MGQQCTAPRGMSPYPQWVAVVGVTALAAFLMYLDRVCISFTEGYVRESLGLDPGQMGWALGAFFLSYALAQVPAGWLSDRFGARRMMVCYIVAWSGFTAATGLATGLFTLLAARLALGMAQAGAYPAAAGLMRHWVPARTRGQANSIVTLGGRLGGAVAPLLTALLLVVLVPAGSSWQLEEGDLLDLPKLCRQLGHTGKDLPARLGQRIVERLPGSLQTTFAEVGSLEKPEALDTETRTRIRNALNQVLADPNLTDGLEWSNVALPREAIRLLKIPATARQPAQIEHRNRLVLEAVYPGIIRQVYGRAWRRVLVMYGTLGLMAALIFWKIVRDRPESQPRVHAAEVGLVSQEDTVAASPAPASHGSIPWRQLVTSRNMWLSALTQFGINFGWVFLITLLPRYLADAFAVPIEKRGTMAMVPLLAACVGMFVGGRLTDWLTGAVGLRWGRAFPIGATLFVCAGAFLLCPLLSGPWAVVLALAVMALAVDLGVPAIWSFVQDVAGGNAGAALGWGNMWGNLGAALSPVLLSTIQSAWGWTSVFLTCAVTFALAGFAGLGIDATKPLGTERRRSGPG